MIAPPFALKESLFAGRLNPVLERPLGRALEPDVERQADVVARLRRPALGGPALALWNPHRVDAQLGGPRRAAEIAVECRLDTGLADLLAAAVALRLEALELLLVDLAHVAEHLRRQRPVLVVAQVRGHDRDPRELVRALEQRHHLVLVDGCLDEDRRQRVVLALLERSWSAGAAARAAPSRAASASRTGPPWAGRRSRSAPPCRARWRRPCCRRGRGSSRAAPRAGRCAAGCSAPRSGSGRRRAPGAPRDGGRARRR